MSKAIYVCLPQLGYTIKINMKYKFKILDKIFIILFLF